VLKRLNWPTVSAALVVLLAIAIVGVFGAPLGVPVEVSRGALAFLGAVGTLVLGAMRAFLRDADGNGIPDRLEDKECDD
jgi:hypothetical protein